MAIAQAQAGNEGLPSTPPEEQLAQLQRVLQRLDRFGAEGARPVDQEQSAEIDRRLKACRSLLADTGSEQGKQAAQQKHKAREEKAARKAAKQAAQRAASEAGVGILPAAAGAAHPAVKRPRTS